MDDLDSLRIQDVPEEAAWDASQIRTWLISRHVCALLTSRPDETLQEMRDVFAQFYKPGYLTAEIIEQWRGLLDAGPQAVIEALRESGDRAQHMRQTCPLPTIEEAHRMRLLATARRIAKEKLLQAGVGAIHSNIEAFRRLKDL